MSVKKQAVSGVKWTTISTVILAITEVLKMAVLTRFLEKEDFGLMALVMIVMGFMSLFNDMGLTTAILYKQNISRKEYASLYWLNWMVSTGIYIILFLISPLVSSFYKEELLTVLIPIIGVNLFFSSLGNQYRTIDQKKLLFKNISIIEIISAVGSLVVAVVLAINGFRVYALVYSLLFRIGLANLIFFITGVKKYGLLFYFKMSQTKPFLKVGLYQVGSQVVNYFNRDIDVLLVGKLFSPEILGGYHLARDLVRKPSGLISSIVNRVGAPTLAKFVGNKEQLKSNYLKITNLLASVTIPMYIGIIIFAYPLVYVIYGEPYIEITILVQILSVNMIFRVIGGNIGNLIVATGRTDIDFKWNLLTVFVVPLFVYLGSLNNNITWVAIMVTISNVFLFVPGYFYLVKPLINKITLKEYFKAFFFIRRLKI